MFTTLTEKFQSLFQGLHGKQVLDEESIAEASREVRLALLDADVNYAVVSQLVKSVKEKLAATKIPKESSAREFFAKIMHEELVQIMGGEEPTLNIGKSPSCIMMCGLQGAGKTTQSAKLAAYLQKKPYNKSVMLAACDLQRPAAVLQLTRLGEQIGVPVFSIEGCKDPLEVAKGAIKAAVEARVDVLIVDTAGRLHIDQELMDELRTLRKHLDPSELLFVASSMIGQDAVKTACEFDKQIGITGTILTMLDGSARAGAALSICEVTKKPLKFEGIGEKIDEFQLFNPKSMADRILGMGDLINLARKMEAQQTEEEKEALNEKVRKASFTYDDFLSQMGKMQKMGSIKGLLKMLPGAANFAGLETSESEFKKFKAMIESMTPAERREDVEFSLPRRMRVAKGSGNSVDDLNRMVKGFKRLKEMMKSLPMMQKQMAKQFSGKLPV